MKNFLSSFSSLVVVVFGCVCEYVRSNVCVVFVWVKWSDMSGGMLSRSGVCLYSSYPGLNLIGYLVVLNKSSYKFAVISLLFRFLFHSFSQMFISFVFIDVG